MGWNSVIGQERVKSLLKKTISGERVAHAYLFYGPEGTGKDALALEFAKALNCKKGGMEACNECDPCRRAAGLNYPDTKLVFALPVGKNEKTGDDPVSVLTEQQIAEIREQIGIKAKDPYHRIEIYKSNFIKINSIRDIRREASMAGIGGGRKIFIILNADMMNAEASNSLLKTLEEPLGGIVIILTTSLKEKLLPTIVSRCQLVRCDMLQQKEIEDALVSRELAERTAARICAQFAGGSYTEARKLLGQDVAGYRNEIIGFMRLVLGKNKTMLSESIEVLASASDRAGIREWLRILQSWLRDALLYQQNANVEILESEKTSLENFNKNFSEADLVKAAGAVEKAVAHLDKNIYLPLILSNMVLELRRNIIGRRTL